MIVPCTPSGSPSTPSSWVFFGFLWVRFVVDWVQVFARSWSPCGPLLVGLEAVYSATDPPIKALRRVIPPLRIGRSPWTSRSSS